MQNAVFAAVLLILLPASTALGVRGVKDRTCYEIEGSSVKLKALADLYTPQFGPDSDCKVRKAALFCVPSHKEVTSEVPSKKKGLGDVEVTAFDSICYRIRCRKPFPRNQTATDEFGTHTFKKVKPRFLCVPALKPCADATLTFAGSRFENPVVGGTTGACRRFDADPDACNRAYFAQHGSSKPMSCAYNTTRLECHGCGGNQSQPGCTNKCFACADTARTLIPGPRASCRDLTTQAACDAAWIVGGLVAETCFWDAASSNCLGCGPANEVGEGHCSVTTADTCREDVDCDFGELCIDNVSRCQNSCREPLSGR